VSPSDHLDPLDESLVDHIKTGGTSDADRRSLLALHLALAARGDFGYLEVGSYHGASLQSFVADPRCRTIVSIDRRDEVSPDNRSEPVDYPENTTNRMLEHLSEVPGADLGKLTAIDATTADVEPAEMNADFCFIDAEHTDAAALDDARFCLQVIRGRGLIVFHDRTLVADGIDRFLRGLSRYRAYPLAHELLVVEVGIPSLLSDPRVKAQLPHKAWIVVDRLRAMRLVVRLGPMARRFRSVFGRSALILGAPHRSRRRAAPSTGTRPALFKIHTFVNDAVLYERMRQSFIDGGFNPDAFVRLTDSNDDPYTAITRLGQDTTVRYPILCHQDIVANKGVSAEKLLAALQELDTIDPHWVVAGNAGVMRSGRLLLRVIDEYGSSTAEPLPLPVVSLDELFLVFNGRTVPRCSTGLSDFHLYATDACLNALASGGSAYVIDFPVTHVRPGNTERDTNAATERNYWLAWERAQKRLIKTWRERCVFRYVLTPATALFMSRFKVLQRLFGSPWAVSSVEQCRQAQRDLSQLRPIDAIATPELLRRAAREWSRRARAIC
jgi:hypothetical protein